MDAKNTRAKHEKKTSGNKHYVSLVNRYQKPFELIDNVIDHFLQLPNRTELSLSSFVKL